MKRPKITLAVKIAVAESAKDNYLTFNGGSVTENVLRLFEVREDLVMQKHQLSRAGKLDYSPSGCDSDPFGGFSGR